MDCFTSYPASWLPHFPLSYWFEALHKHLSVDVLYFMCLRNFFLRICKNDPWSQFLLLWSFVGGSCTNLEFADLQSKDTAFTLISLVMMVHGAACPQLLVLHTCRYWTSFTLFNQWLIIVLLLPLVADKHMPSLCLIDNEPQGKAIVAILPRDTRVMLMEIIHCNNCKVEDDGHALLDTFHSENHQDLRPFKNSEETDACPKFVIKDFGAMQVRFLSWNLILAKSRNSWEDPSTLAYDTTTQDLIRTRVQGFETEDKGAKGRVQQCHARQ